MSELKTWNNSALPDNDLRSLRIGFLTPLEQFDPDALSGAPYRIYTALKELAGEVVLLLPDGAKVSETNSANNGSRVMAKVYRRFRNRVWHPDGILRVMDHWAPSRVYGALMRRSRHDAVKMDRRIRESRLDGVVGAFATWYLHALDTSVPFVHFSDGTVQMVNRSYAERQSRGPGYHRAWEEMEKGTMRRAAAIALATDEARKSAMEDYGVEPDRVIVSANGATVMPASPDEINLTPPDGKTLKLCIVAGDPIRKRLSLAIECVDLLAEMGWDAKLTYIGPATELLSKSSRVSTPGRLRLSDVEDRAKHRAILSESHMMILPSSAEAAGIAPAEAAHFGRPSIVSSAGGLPTMVKHDITGLVMPMDSGPRDYAEAIDRLCRDPQRYRRMAQAALHRAQTELTWTACANRLLTTLSRAIKTAPTPA